MDTDIASESTTYARYSILVQAGAAMLKSEIDELLRQTLSDLRLSRSEKKSLRSVLEGLDLSEGDYGQLRKSAFEIASEELKDSHSTQVIEWIEDVMKVLVPRQESAEKPPKAYFSPETDCRSRILSLFHAARQSIDICVFTITDNQLSREILATHARGLKVRIITCLLYTSPSPRDRG